MARTARFRHFLAAAAAVAATAAVAGTVAGHATMTLPAQRGTLNPSIDPTAEKDYWYVVVHVGCPHPAAARAPGGRCRRQAGLPARATDGCVAGES